MDRPLDVKSLTSLRFLAALWVFVAHFGAAFGLSLSNLSLVQRGYLGVEFFFLLSGFIICHVYRAAFADGGPRYDHIAFLVKRLARIYPLHLFTLSLFVATGGVALAAGIDISVDKYFRPEKLPLQLLLVQAWWEDGYSFNTPAWSISAEWFAYLMFPVFMAWSRKPILLAGVMTGLFAAWIVICPMLLDVIYAHTNRFQLVRVFCMFGLGVGLRQIVEHRTFWGTAFPSSIYLWLIVTIECAALAAPDSVTMAAIVMVILSGFERGRRGTDGFAEKPAFIYLGEISFGFYMLHYFVGLVFMGLSQKLGFGLEEGPMAPRILAWTAMLVATVIAAALTEKWLERPARSLIISRFQTRRGRVRQTAG